MAVDHGALELSSRLRQDQGYKGSGVAHSLIGEIKAAMKDATKSPGVLIAIIICATIVSLSLVGILGWLAWAQRDASFIMTLVNTVLAAWSLKRVSDVDGRVGKVEQQTNGHMTRVMDAAFTQRTPPDTNASN